MKASALKMVRNTPAPVATSPDQSAPVEPVKPVSEPVNTGISPANDPKIGVVYGSAPDPASEASVRPDSVFSDDNVDNWTPKTLDLESANESIGPKYLEIDGPAATAVVSNMEEADFIEFWSVDVYDAISGAFALFRVDISEIETEDDELEQARKAAKNLYRLAKRRPKVFGWMLSETTLEGADWMMCVGFFGGKVAALVAGIKERRLEKKQKALEKARGEDTTTPFLKPKNQSGPVIEGEVVSG